MSKAKRKLTQHDLEQAWLEAFIERHGGRVSPRLLVDDARDPNCPFHHRIYADDDETAADRYRMQIASQIIREWKGSIMKIDTEARVVHVESVRRVQSPMSSRGKGRESYETIEQIMADPQKRDDMVATVLRELNAYRKRYASILALSDVWDAIDQAMQLHGQPEGKQSGAEDRAAV